MIDDATPYQALNLFRRFYGGADGLEEVELESMSRELAKKVEGAMKEGLRVSMATLQGHFIRCEAKEALEGWDALCKMAKEDAKARAQFASMP